MANTLCFNQLATVLGEITKQVTGKSAIAITDTSTFVSVAQTALLSGYDPLINAISQVLSNTLFSGRPYTRKFGGLKADAQRYGNHVRKIQVCDSDFEDDQRLTLVDATSVDQFKVKKPVVLQTNFYGQNQFQKHITIFRDQLDTAFSGPDEFGRFISLIMTNATAQIEQAHESTARATLANFIAGKVVGDPTNVIHLVTEYNTINGTTLTAVTVKQAANFVPFTKWMFGRIKTLSEFMTERSQKYHVNVTGKEISRHSPMVNQKIYLHTPELNNIESSVLSSVYNEGFLKLADHETVNFWQSIDTPDTIKVKPSYMLPDGTVKTPATATTQANILGVIFDEEAVGYTTINEWSAPSPFNAAGGYTNMFWHFTNRYWNDNTENAIVLLLD